MTQASFPYVDLTVLPEISPHVIASHAAVLFSPDLKRVFWANGEGAKLLGTPTIGLAVEGSVVPNAATMRQIGMAVDKLANDEEASAAMRIQSGFKTRLLAFRVRKILLPGKHPAVLLVTDALHGRGHTDTDMAQAAVDCLDGSSHASAIFDRQGALIAASNGFAELKITQKDLKLLADEISSEEDQLIKRVLDTDSKPMAAGIARVGSKPALHLMILTETSSGSQVTEINLHSPDVARESKTIPTSLIEPSTPRVGAFSSKRIKDGLAGPDRWYFKQQKTDDPSELSRSTSEEVEKTEPESEPNRTSRVVKVDHTNPPKTRTVPLEDPPRGGYLLSDATENNTESDNDFRFAAGARPVRFVWEMDANMVFSSVSPELSETVGKQSADIEGRSWNEVSVLYGLDDRAEITSLLAKGDTWSGKTVLWPVEETDLRVPVDLAGLPSFDRNRQFAGFNGFGVIRTSDALVDPGETGLHLAKEGSLEDQSTTNEPTENGLGPSTELNALSPPHADGGSLQDNTDRTDGRSLSSGEREAFDEIREKLGREKPGQRNTAPKADPSDNLDRDLTKNQSVSAQDEDRVIIPSAFVARKVRTPVHDVDTSILARLPIPVLVYRHNDLLFANTDFYKLTGYRDLEHLASVGGVDALFGSNVDSSIGNDARILHSDGTKLNVHPNLQRVPWDEDRAMLLTLRKHGPDDDAPTDAPPTVDEGRETKEIKGNKRLARDISIVAPPTAPTGSTDVGAAPKPKQKRYSPVKVKKISRGKQETPKVESTRQVPVDKTVPKVQMSRTATTRFTDLNKDDLQGILDTATDGVVILSEHGGVTAFNRSAEALFDCSSNEATGKDFGEFLAPESRQIANSYLAEMNNTGVASLMNDGREVIGQTARGGLIPLFMTTGRMESNNLRCAILKDITQWKKAEEELLSAKKLAEDANVQKSEFLAKISHEVRTPLNAIIGFSDIMLEERFGTISNDRYRDYIRDIHRSGNHVLDLINDLLDISKIEAGEWELSFDACNLSAIVSETVALSQPQANKERIIIRTSLSDALPQIVADQRSLKQIVLNLVTNSIKFTEPGGQVIVSTVYEDGGEVVLRVRDTGVGMSNEELAKALKPFTQIGQVSEVRKDGSGLGLPLTKAMVEANRAKFHIQSEPGKGTLVEIYFPSQRVLAER